MLDIEVLILVGLFLFIVVLTALGIVVGRKPAMTEFEARQRGLTLPARSQEEKARDRARSDASMRDAAKAFTVFAIGSAIAALLVYLVWPGVLVYLLPVFAGLGILLIFVIMWLDEERIKARYRDIRIE